MPELRFGFSLRDSRWDIPLGNPDDPRAGPLMSRLKKILHCLGCARAILKIASTPVALTYILLEWHNHNQLCEECRRQNEHGN